MSMLEKFMVGGVLVVSLLAMSTNIYQIVTKAEQGRRDERRWAQERALIENGRLERLYRVQSESLGNIPYVAIESKESDRMEKLYRFHSLQ